MKIAFVINAGNFVCEIELSASSLKSYFSKNFNKPRVRFFAFGRKTKFIGNFEKTFEIFQMFLKKIEKMY